MVYHLAAAVGVELIVESPVRTIETNVHCTEVVLAQASKKKKPVFIASTSEVYGKSTDLPFREDGDLVLGPTVKGRWSYACSKAIDEFLAIAYWKERQLPTVVGRLFNTVGPRQTGRYGMVIPNFVAPGARRPADHRLRRRDAAALLLPRLRRRPRPRRPDGARRRLRRGLQHRLAGGGLDPRARRAGHGGDRLVLGDQARALRRGLRGGLRGHAAPHPRHDEDPRAIGWEPTQSLDEILADVVDEHRAGPG